VVRLLETLPQVLKYGFFSILLEVRGIEPLFSCFLKEASPKAARIVY